jgi:acetylornithine/N-succinyldiaminopimelate aminotransferase
MAARRASAWPAAGRPDFADTVFFTNSGAEAVECAIKTARAYHQHVGNDHKFELITFNNAFHGRTMATISASSQEKMHKGFLPLLPGFKYVPFDDLEAVKAAIGPNTAGFLVEPIQGEGGIARLAGIHGGPARAGRRA